MVIKINTENKTKRFLKKHWKKGLVILGVAAIGGVCGYAVSKNFSKRYKLKDLIDIMDNSHWEFISEKLREGALLDKADDHIYVAVVPSLYQAVLDKNVEKKVIETAYDLGDNLSKLVTITVENVYGD